MLRALAVVAIGVLGTAGAAAADEGDWTLAAGPTFATLGAGDTSYGGGVALDVAYGVTDALSLRLTGAGSVHAAGASATLPSQTAFGWFGGAGVTYTIDIVRLVPYVEFAVGILGATRQGAGCCELGLQAGVGVDYLYTPKVAFGLIARYAFSVTSSAAEPTLLVVGPRVVAHF